MRIVGAVLVVLALLLSHPARADESPAQVTRLKVRPAAEGAPALRYRLVPERRDLKPGNAAELYYRAFAPEWLTHRKPDIAPKFDALALERGEAPPAEFRWVQGAKYLQEVDRAARRFYCDWGLEERFREEGIGVNIPEAQGLREIARLLTLRARFEMHDGKHDRVQHTLQTGLVLGRHLGEGPMLILSLIGGAVSHEMLTEVEEWIQQPGSPNLYWPLTNLPRPFINMVPAIESERIFTDILMPGLRDSVAGDKAEALPAARAEELFKRTLLHLTALEVGDLRQPRVADKLTAAFYVRRLYPQAKKNLIERGKKAELVEKMPPIQVALLEELHNIDRVFDESLKLWGLPHWERAGGIARLEQEFRAMRSEPAVLSRGTVLANLLTPAVAKVMGASARFERRVAMLRTVEALRLHAAAHDGKLPARLDDVKKVPVPADPMTGKPFTYHADGDTATLYAPPPPGKEKVRAEAVRFEITLVR